MKTTRLKTSLYWLITLTMTSYFSFASAPGCPQIDHTNLDSDGMPFCPDQVNSTSAWAVYNCAIQQANSFHVPTAAEKNQMNSLLTNFKTSTVSGISQETTTGILTAASALNLQACRVKNTVQDNGQSVTDSFLVIYVKPGVRDYSGPFLMLRETRASKVIIIGPHDDSDGTYADTKLAMAHSHALATISNGHIRGHISGPTNGDFVHETNNLGTMAVRTMGQLFPNYVVLHIHGMKITDRVLYRSRNALLGTTFEKMVVDNTNIQPNAFGALNASFTIDNLVNTNFYVKTEMPARIHVNTQMALAKMTQELEQQTWAWPTAAAE